MVNLSMCAKFQVCIVFRLARRRDTNTYTNIRMNLRISSTGCSPHVDFDFQNFIHKSLNNENFDGYIQARIRTRSFISSEWENLKFFPLTSILAPEEEGYLFQIVLVLPLNDLNQL